MMKRYLSYMASLLLGGMALTACTDESAEPSGTGNDGGATFTLSLSTRTLTARATEEGESAYHENDVNRITCYFYPSGQSETANAQFSLSTEVPDLTRTDEGQYTATVKLSREQLEQLFTTGTDGMPADGATCEVYVMANLPEGTAVGEKGTTVSALKQTEIESEFNKDYTADGSDFVMDGQSSVTYASSTRTLTGNVDLTRAASKIALFVTVPVSSVTDANGDTWEPVLSQGMQVYYYYSVKKSRVDIGTGANDQTAGNYVTLSSTSGTDGTPGTGGRPFSTTEKKDTDEHDIYGHAPFYSYSSDWGRTDDPDEEAYMVLVVPWKKAGTADSEYQSYYYQVPVSPTDKKLERNTYYKLNLSVGILGSTKPQTAVTLTPSYIVVDWQEAEMEAALKDYRFLTVDQNSVTLYNQPTVSIGYSSSHECEIVNATISHPVFNPQTAEDWEGTVPAKSETTDTLYYQLDGTKGGNIKFFHKLINQGDKDENDNEVTNYHYYPYTITLTIRHTDDETKTFSETIEITQYPAMYIEADRNTDYTNSTDYNTHKGYVYVNGKTDNTYGTVNGITSSTKNQNPNRYIISLSTLSKTSTDKIGDPRKTTIDLLNNTSNWATAQYYLNGTLSTDTRQLAYYYPTETSSNAENMIAPKFRIASSYGVTTDISWDNAQKRCASYQEDGYPAGRWRMPTTAEIKYIIKLTADGKIPTLFTEGNNYWSGKTNTYCSYSGTTVTTSTSTGNGPVRCVYDDWYWGSEPMKDASGNRITSFAWGDKER